MNIRGPHCESGARLRCMTSPDLIGSLLICVAFVFLGHRTLIASSTKPYLRSCDGAYFCNPKSFQPWFQETDVMGSHNPGHRICDRRTTHREFSRSAVAKKNDEHQCPSSCPTFSHTRLLIGYSHSKASTPIFASTPWTKIRFPNLDTQFSESLLDGLASRITCFPGIFGDRQIGFRCPTLCAVSRTSSVQKFEKFDSRFSLRRLGFPPQFGRPSTTSIHQSWLHALGNFLQSALICYSQPECALSILCCQQHF